MKGSFLSSAAARETMAVSFCFFLKQAKMRICFALTGAGKKNDPRKLKRSEMQFRGWDRVLPSFVSFTAADAPDGDLNYLR